MVVFQKVVIVLGSREYPAELRVRVCDDGGCGAAVPEAATAVSEWTRVENRDRCPAHLRSGLAVRDDWSDLLSPAEDPTS